MATDLDEMLAFTEAFLRAPEQKPRPLVRAPIDVAEPRVRFRPRPKTQPVVRAERASRPRRTLPTCVLVVVLLALPTVGPSLRVHVDGRLVEVTGHNLNVATVLRRSRIAAVDGVLLSAVTHRIIDRHFDPAVVLRNGRPAAKTAGVRSGDYLEIRQGRPWVETAVHRTVPVPGGALPDITYGLWNLPKAGVTNQLVGSRSQEVISEQPVSPAVAATPVTDLAVGFSFDDGPNPQWTPAILAILKSAGIKATFCIVGYAAERYPELVKAIRDDGHTLCNHTMHHVQLLGGKSPDTITNELRDDSALIERASGERPRFFRAPGGTWATNLVAEVRRQGMQALGWNVDPADFERPGAAVITNRIMSQLRPGAVILMHDGGGDRSQTLAQLPALIARLRALGYTFRVPVA
ncbi:MAG TPA: polysaccharide deacetylase family protein [Acidimicrobiales bacterium]|nr:polysaccharide deacetylase family protein [Acidimicrobiales bacterium]